MEEASIWMMIDGTLNPRAMAHLYKPEITGEAIPILQGTPYEKLADSGPLLARVVEGSDLLRYWESNDVPLRHAWQFRSPLRGYDLAEHWRRRLLIRGPMGRLLWLRFADARVVARGLCHHAFPPGFWHAIDTLQLSAQQGDCSLLPTAQWNEPRTAALGPHFTLSERQLASLSPEPALEICS